MNLEAGFWKKTTRKLSSKQGDLLNYLYLSNEAWNHLTNLWVSPDYDTLLPTDRNQKENNQIKLSHERYFIELYSDSSHDYSENSPKFRFLEAVKQEYLSLKASPRITKEIRAKKRMEMTPMGLYPNLALAVSLSFGKTSNQALYSNYRQSNIHAMFLANGFLTWLDRRPYDGDWDFVWYWPDEELEQLEFEQDPISPAQYAAYTLRHYYRNNPDAYSILDPLMSKDQWKVLPAYYHVRELPNFNVNLKDSETENTSKFKMPIKYTFAGVAIGPNAKYIVHHTQKGSTPWYISVERSTQRAAHRSLVEAQLLTSNDPEFRNALVIAENSYQTISFFEQLRQRKRATGHILITDPYTSIHLVLLNHSGCRQLRSLMLYGSELINDVIADQMIKTDAAYCKEKGLEKGRLQLTNDSIFHLLYTPENNAAQLPVFIGHGMEICEIERLCEAYEAGRKFLISCYPEQISVYQKLFPGIEFL